MNQTIHIILLLSNNQAFHRVWFTHRYNYQYFIHSYIHGCLGFIEVMLRWQDDSTNADGPRMTADHRADSLAKFFGIRSITISHISPARTEDCLASTIREPSFLTFDIIYFNQRNGKYLILCGIPWFNREQIYGHSKILYASISMLRIKIWPCHLCLCVGALNLWHWLSIFGEDEK